jgi:hypothetical protein
MAIFNGLLFVGEPQSMGVPIVITFLFLFLSVGR